jgi:hypothetical protein
MKSILDRIPIIHLHGQLGQLPWQGDKGRPFYHGIEATDDLLPAIQGIKIIHEDITDGATLIFSELRTSYTSIRKMASILLNAVCAVNRENAS